MGGIKKTIIQTFKGIIYLIYPTRYKNTIWLIGSGRSGTTWIASMINFKGDYRQMFEPFHTIFPEMRYLGFKKNLFLDDKTKKWGVRFLAKKVLKGKFYKRRVEKDNDFITAYQNDFLIVKDIFANLMAYDICSKSKKIKPILLIRNPFAVVLSLWERKSGDWMGDPMDFLQQKRLKEKYLRPFESMIIEISLNGSYFEKQVLIWCIINYIPLVQFESENLLVTFYEDWVLDPNSEFERVNKYLGIKKLPNQEIDKDPKFSSPSRTSKNTSFDNISAWKKDLSAIETTSGMKILKSFGFDQLYNENSEPNHELIKQFSSSQSEN